jgi:hypothetical protein
MANIVLRNGGIRRNRHWLLYLAALMLPALGHTAGASEPRIVNIYNFVRDNDFRMAHSEAVLYEATAEQIRLLKRAGLPATFALQYDALMDTNYQKLFKAEMPGNCEIGAWWEIPQALAEKAGLKWRGDHEWDPRANMGFSPAYTPAERRKLVDVYMADFKAVFGYYPKTAGSWYIDEVTLDYMARRYGVVASCNCKDQVGTDFYTLWGGYWNQAYYPSRVNAYMPAQSKAQQLDMPIFRMLGSDPIYQHGTTPGMFTLEPVYREAGGSTEWVAWYMNNFVEQPSLAFAFVQAGQENSFGWDAMKSGLTEQVRLIESLARAGKVRVETLAQAGEWFRSHYALTPPTSVVALDDWRHEGRKTVWYDSRFYRVNFLWENGGFFIRDLHCFNENLVSPTHDTPLTATSLAYETLPIMDWALWSRSATNRVGMWPVLVASDGAASPMVPEGKPSVEEAGAKDLRMVQGLAGGGTFSVTCRENGLSCAGADGAGRPLRWAWDLIGGAGQKAVLQSVTARRVNYRSDGVNYELKVKPGSCESLADGTIRFSADSSGRLGITVR